MKNFLISFPLSSINIYTNKHKLLSFHLVGFLSLFIYSLIVKNNYYLSVNKNKKKVQDKLDHISKIKKKIIRYWMTIIIIYWFDLISNHQSKIIIVCDWFFFHYFLIFGFESIESINGFFSINSHNNWLMMFSTKEKKILNCFLVFNFTIFTINKLVCVCVFLWMEPKIILQKIRILFIIIIIMVHIERIWKP